MIGDEIAHTARIRPDGVRLPKWLDEMPRGRIERAYLHWSGYDYRRTFDAYHVCVAIDERGRIVVVPTHDVRDNMRDVRAAPELPYAAHTSGRNSWAIGLSVMGMQDATPGDFGAYPLRADMLAALLAATGAICAAYGIAIERESVMTHAEAAALDGYFGIADDERWDLARLEPAPRPLTVAEANATGDLLRGRLHRDRAVRGTVGG